MMIENFKIEVDGQKIAAEDVASGACVRLDPNYVILALRGDSPGAKLLADKLTEQRAARRPQDKTSHVSVAFDECYVKGLGSVSKLSSRGSIAPNAALASDGSAVVTYRFVLTRKLGDGWGLVGKSAAASDDDQLRAELAAKDEECESLRATLLAQQAKIKDLEEEVALQAEALKDLEG